MNIIASHPPTRKAYRPGIKWHTRMACSLDMFVRHLEIVLEETRLHGPIPVDEFLHAGIAVRSGSEEFPEMDAA